MLDIVAAIFRQHVWVLRLKLQSLVFPSFCGLKKITECEWVRKIERERKRERKRNCVDYRRWRKNALRLYDRALVSDSVTRLVCYQSSIKRIFLQKKRTDLTTFGLFRKMAFLNLNLLWQLLNNIRLLFHSIIWSHWHWVKINTYICDRKIHKVARRKKETGRRVPFGWKRILFCLKGKCLKGWECVCLRNRWLCQREAGFR